MPLLGSLHEGGEYTLVQGIPVLNIGRADLGTKKNRFAWGLSDLPPILGMPVQNPTNITEGKFEVEKSKVECLMRLLGYSNFATSNPNLEQETGVDVAVECDGRRIGFQVTDFHSDESAGSSRKGSELRRQESEKVKNGLPAPTFVNLDPIPGLVQRIKDKSKKRWSKRDFPEMNLLIAASVLQLPGVASTFMWSPKVDLSKLNSQLSSLLAGCDYFAVYLYNMMQGHVHRWTKAAGWENVV